MLQLNRRELALLTQALVEKQARLTRRASEAEAEWEFRLMPYEELHAKLIAEWNVMKPTYDEEIRNGNG